MVSSSSLPSRSRSTPRPRGRGAELEPASLRESRAATKGRCRRRPSCACNLTHSATPRPFIHSPDGRGRRQTNVVGGRSIAHDPANPNWLEFHNLIKSQRFGLCPCESSTKDDQNLPFEQMGRFHATEIGAKSFVRKGLAPKLGGGGQKALMFVGEFDASQ